MSPLTRREFMKTFGVGLASLVIAGCRLSSQNPPATKKPPKPTETPVITCYMVVTLHPHPHHPPTSLRRAISCAPAG